ncbi:MAG TPA: ABC transporter permease, partial [Gemmatimonadaceae bacterium]|nr:ABC transporter permease [Gemmatimonadaceae bacterium]
MNAPRTPHPSPPTLALALLDKLLSTDVRDVLVGDMLERFHGDRTDTGLGVARVRFWRETAVALIRFGVLSHLVRSRHQESRVSSFAADLRFAARVLRRAPAFALLCIATLALAMGPTAAVLSIVEALLVRPLPYMDGDRLAFLFERAANGNPVTMGFATVGDVRAQATSFASVAAAGNWQTTISSPVDPEKLAGLMVSWNYFRTLGVNMAVGRDFASREDSTGSPVIILTQGLWSRRFGGDTGIVGRTIDLEGRPYVVAGVLPASYDDVV